MPHCVNVGSFLILWATLLEILCSPFPGQGMRILIKDPEELLKGSEDKGENLALLGSIKSLVAGSFLLNSLNSLCQQKSV